MLSLPVLHKMGMTSRRSKKKVGCLLFSILISFSPPFPIILTAVCFNTSQVLNSMHNLRLSGIFSTQVLHFILHFSRAVNIKANKSDFKAKAMEIFVFKFCLCSCFLHQVFSGSVIEPNVISPGDFRGSSLQVFKLKSNENDIYNLTIEWNPRRENIFVMQFDALVAWSDRFVDESRERTVLKDVISAYIGDLIKKKQMTFLTLKLHDFHFDKTELVTSTRFKLDIVCASKNPKTADKCQNIVETIAGELKSSDILRYFHEIGSIGNILPGLQSLSQSLKMLVQEFF